MASQDDTKTRAEALKAEGNAFHLTRKYKDACAKYSEAIKLDDRNAILYANRAAAHLELREYLDAACDAKKATELDPGYVKGWARLGKASMALHIYDESMNAWNKAVALCVPSNGGKLTRVEEQQKQSCLDGMNIAKDAKARRDRQTNANAIIVSANAQSLPWQRAMTMEADAEKIGVSSAWVILIAYREFKQGCDKMKQTTHRNGMLVGPFGAIIDISNAVLRDSRAFHLDSPEWVNLYNRQMVMEATFSQAWMEDGPKEVQAKALKMQQEKGWDAVRPALALTVRGWFMRGFIVGATTQDHRSAVQYLRSAISVLEWGCEVWKDVPKEDRGAIFSLTFIRGYKRFFIESYLAAYKVYGPSKEYTLDELEKLADAMIKDVEANPLTGNEGYVVDAGFLASFFLYPQAEAYAAQGFVQIERGKQIKDSDPQTASAHFGQAAKLYLKAGNTLPPDEEKAFLFFKVAFEAYWFQGAPLRMCLPICECIHQREAQVAKIWEHSSMARPLSQQLSVLWRYEAKAMIGIMSGVFTFESPSTVIDLMVCA